MMIDTTDPLVLARALIQCPSVTPLEGGALTLLEEWLSQAGFEVSRPVFQADQLPDVENLFAAIGMGEKHLCLAGHTDVVPPGDLSLWHYPPFSGEVTNGMLYGRGAADMKGGVAALTAAALSFIGRHGQNFGGRLSFLITGDEEGPAVNGTAKLLEWAKARGERFSAALLGEPTSLAELGDTIKVGRRGSLSATLTLHGVQGHVAYPHLADNPLRALPAFMHALLHPPLDAGMENFQPSNLEIVAVETGNPAFNVIPGAVRVNFNVRFNALWTVERLQRELRQRLETAALDSPLRQGREPLKFTLAFNPYSAPSFLTRSDTLIDAMTRAIGDVTQRQPALSTGGGTSDARFIMRFCPVIEFGLVGETMHQVNERIALADLYRLKEIYLRFMENYFEV